MELGRGRVDGLPFVRVLGRGPRVGEGTLFTYTVYVERGTGFKPVVFTRTVEAILADERGWIRGGEVAFQRLPKYAGTQVVLATPPTVDRLCAPLQTEGKVSCNMGTKVVINAVRWREGVPHWTEPLSTYREALLNHEVGHRIGQGHRDCPGAGKKFPIMMQFTYGLQGCSCCNSWPLDHEVASL
jgi:hypothetical protein